MQEALPTSAARLGSRLFGGGARYCSRLWHERVRWIKRQQIGVRPFDPFPYRLLTMVVSLEAIFLSTLVLISQNRLSEESEHRAD
jgi:uncharacterized membrane protein